jgi:hypothetical protein
MVNWVRKISENRLQKQQETERTEKVEEERKTAAESNRKKAVSFISDVVVPAFEKAKGELEGDTLKMCARYAKPEGDTSIEIEVRKKATTRAEHQPFRYRVEMEYTSCSVTACAVCSSGDRHNIEKTTDSSAIARTSFELVNITVDDIYNDLMKCFANHDGQP